MWHGDAFALALSLPPSSYPPVALGPAPTPNLPLPQRAPGKGSMHGLPKKPYQSKVLFTYPSDAPVPPDAEKFALPRGPVTGRVRYSRALLMASSS